MVKVCYSGHTVEVRLRVRTVIKVRVRVRIMGHRLGVRGGCKALGVLVVVGVL